MRSWILRPCYPNFLGWDFLLTSFSLTGNWFWWEQNIVVFFLLQLFCDWERCVDKTIEGFGSEDFDDYSVNHNPSLTWSSSRADISHYCYWPQGVVVGESTHGIDDRSKLVPALREIHAFDHRWVHTQHSDSLTNVSGNLITVCIVNITSLFEDVIASVCYSMQLLAALIKRCDEMLFLARVRRVTSIPTRQIIDQRLHFTTELILVVCDSEKSLGGT